MGQKNFKASGISCQHCVAKVEKTILGIEGVKSVTVLQEEQMVKLDAEPMPNLETLNTLLENSGNYKLSV